MAKVIVENHSPRAITMVIKLESGASAKQTVPEAIAIGPGEWQPGVVEVEDSFLNKAKEHKVIAALFEKRDLRVGSGKAAESEAPKTAPKTSAK